ncbi:MAG: hypothetical protein ACM3VS_16190 [Candidatus Dadabacteria bacterium]
MIENTTNSPDRSKPTLSSSQRGQQFDNSGESTSENKEPGKQNQRHAKVPSRDRANLTEIGKRGLVNQWHSLL